MNWEKSCGAVVFTKRNGDPEFLIVQEQAGAYSFPKGHMESGETEEQTARREVFEETGLVLPFLEGFCVEDEYDLSEKPGTRKRVVYFLAEYAGGPIVLREGEIRGAEFLTFAQALERFEHEGTRRVLARAAEYLNEYHEEAQYGSSEDRTGIE